MSTGWGAILPLMLAGCVSVGQADLADHGAMAQIKVGHSTKLQVAQLLGQPESRRVIEVGGNKREWWAYSYATATIDLLDYLLIFGFYTNGIGLFDTRYDVTLLIDDRDVVRGLSRTRTDYAMGGPFKQGTISSVSERIEEAAEGGEEPVRFEDRLEFPF